MYSRRYSGYSYWPEYVPVAKRKAQAAKKIAEMSKKGQALIPIIIEGKKISCSVWGQAWCKHLESFSDYENRLPRGRTYVRNGSVIDLKIEAGKILALVQGSSLYKIQIDIGKVCPDKWKCITTSCSAQIGSVIELLQGRLSSSIMAIMTDKHSGLFPLPKEICLKCSCPDSATMCKHIAAVLYGIGARLDTSPELLFILRGVDHMDLIAAASVTTTKTAKSKTIEADLGDVFGIELEEAPATKPTKAPKAELKVIKAKKPAVKPKKKIIKPTAKRVKKSMVKSA